MDTPQFQSRACAKCAVVKQMSEFHKQPRGPMGHHSWCRPCANAAQKASREKNGRPAHRRKWNLSTRYGMTEQQVADLLASQGGLCAICAKPGPKHIDHSHTTGKVRGMLCHGCNIKLAAIEQTEYKAAAEKYLAQFA